MGFPVKVSAELYEKIKERAEEQGSTLQDALVDLLTEGSEQVRELGEELAQARQELRQLARAMAEVQQSFAKAQEQISRLAAEVEELWEKREEDVRALNFWTSHWEKIPTLEEKLDELWKWSDRVDESLRLLEAYRHRHWFQRVG